MNQEDIKSILEIILNKLPRINFNWRLEGSANLLIQGIDVSVKDLDLTTDDEGINIFRSSLKNFQITDVYSEKIKGPSIIYNINGFEVEVNSYGDRKWDLFDKTKFIFWQGLEIPILPLEHAKKFYELIDRTDKVELISRYLKH